MKTTFENNYYCVARVSFTDHKNIAPKVFYYNPITLYGDLIKFVTINLEEKNTCYIGDCQDSTFLLPDKNLVKQLQVLIDFSIENLEPLFIRLNRQWVFITFEK